MAKNTKLPYETAVSGQRAYVEIEHMLRAFGCRNFGVMNHWADGYVLVQFEHRGRMVSLKASWAGYAALWLKRNPYRPFRGRRRVSEAEWKVIAGKKGEVAVPSILRDWIKGQITAVETGLLSFDHAFLGHMLLTDGTQLLDHAQKLLPPPITDEGPAGPEAARSRT